MGFVSIKEKMLYLIEYMKVIHIKNKRYIFIIALIQERILDRL